MSAVAERAGVQLEGYSSFLEAYLALANAKAGEGGSRGSSGGSAFPAEAQAGGVLPRHLH